MTAPLKRRGAAFYAFGDGAISLKGKRRNETWKNRYYLSGDFFPLLVAAYSVTSRGTMLFLRPLPPPAEPGALWMQGRGDNSGNMVLLSLASPLGEEGHEVAKGCWRARIGKKRKVEQAAYRRSG